VILWAAGEPSRLSERARSLLLDEAKSPFLPARPASGKSSSRAGWGGNDSGSTLPGCVDCWCSTGYAELPITADQVLAVNHLPRLHGGPFLIRILVAQARTEGMQLVTTDTQVVSTARGRFPSDTRRKGGSKANTDPGAEAFERDSPTGLLLKGSPYREFPSSSSFPMKPRPSRRIPRRLDPRLSPGSLGRIPLPAAFRAIFQFPNPPDFAGNPRKCRGKVAGGRAALAACSSSSSRIYVGFMRCTAAGGAVARCL